MSAKSPLGSGSEMPVAPKSIGCSLPTKLAPKRAAPVQNRQKIITVQRYQVAIVPVETAPGPARHPAETIAGHRPRRQDDRARRLRSRLFLRAPAAGHHAQEVLGRTRPRLSRRCEGRSARRGDRLAGQHGRQRGPARTSLARLRAQYGAVHGPAVPVLGRAAVDGRRRTDADRDGHVARETPVAHRFGRRRLCPAGCARPASGLLGFRPRS